jgi:hypothetical protein
MNMGINLVGESSDVFAARVEVALIESVNFVRRLFCHPMCLLIVLIINVSYIEDVFPFQQVAGKKLLQLVKFQVATIVISLMENLFPSFIFVSYFSKTPSQIGRKQIDSAWNQYCSCYFSLKHIRVHAQPRDKKMTYARNTMCQILACKCNMHSRQEKHKRPHK